ncbi:5103_t:CDS:2, partial [Scutellospora calospora]
PVNKRAQATSLYIYRQCQGGHNVHQYNCAYCQYIYGTGQEQDQQQKLTSLKIDKCNKLDCLTINFNNTSLSNLFGDNNSNFNR